MTANRFSLQLPVRKNLKWNAKTKTPADLLTCGLTRADWAGSSICPVLVWTAIIVVCVTVMMAVMF